MTAALHSCPHCRQAGIGIVTKWLSSPAMPAQCRHCGGLSYVAAGRSADILLLATLWLMVSGLLAALLGAAWPLLAGALASLVVYCRHWQRASLTATDAKTCAQTEQRHAILNLVAVVLSSRWR